jgi:nucleotide-binding universal stress UspA family protein
MAYKSVLTIATNAEKVAATIAAASSMCNLWDAHLDILVLGVDRVQTGYAYVGASAGLMQMALEQVEATARALDAAVRQAAAREPQTLRWAVEAAVTQLGALTDLVAQSARFSDLVILPKPYGSAQGPEAEAVLEAALFEGQSAVLVLPDSGPDSGHGPVPFDRVVIAWNQSREAMTATRCALPFLKAASSVNIVVIDPPLHRGERADPGAALCQMLVRHGISADVTVLPRSEPRIVDTLNRHVVDQGAGLLVMGAYGHSRFREAVMGGATRSMLEVLKVPVFMAH